MEKIFALKSRQQFKLWNVTAYLMPGGRNQFTGSPKYARQFSSFEEACLMAQKIGGMEVVEINLK